ncbi:MAG TPA: tautomerase family protein [bacterium]|nr:tautomerase family protein [bacterium]
MPVTRLTVNFEIGGKREALADDFQSLLVRILGIREEDRLVLLDEKKEGFFQPADTEGRYALVEIRLFAGRTLATKRKLYRAIVRLFAGWGVPEQNVRIVLHEVPMENWGIRGGQAACDVDPGYRVEV